MAGLFFASQNSTMIGFRGTKFMSECNVYRAPLNQSQIDRLFSGLELAETELFVHSNRESQPGTSTSLPRKSPSHPSSGPK